MRQGDPYGEFLNQAVPISGQIALGLSTDGLSALVDGEEMVTIFRAPGPDELGAALGSGIMETSGANPDYIHVTPQAGYDQWYAIVYGTQVFKTDIPKSLWDELFQNWQWGYDHTRGPGGHIVQVPKALPKFNSVFSGWVPL